MKNSKQILTSLQNRPQFSKLDRYSCIKKIQSLFSAPLQRMIKFAYFKKETLFFVLNHPAGKQEFDNNIQHIKSALNFVNPEECSETKVTDIKAFVTNKITQEIKLFNSSTKKRSYNERASGNIEVSIHDKKLNELIQSIQNIIKDKR